MAVPRRYKERSEKLRRPWFGREQQTEVKESEEGQECSAAAGIEAFVSSKTHLPVEQKDAMC